MKPTVSERVTLVEVLERLRPLEEVAALVQTVVQRLEREGIEALASMQFYADPSSPEISAIITFSDSNHLMDHVNMVSGWEEFKRFSTMIKVTDMRIYGTLTPEAEAWIETFGGPIRKFAHPIAGFVR